MAPIPTRADEVGHGPFTIQIDLSLNYTGSFGPAVDAVQDVFGTPINLGPIFPTATPINGSVSNIGPDGGFHLDVPGNSALGFVADGQFHCDASSGCFTGLPIAFSGAVGTVTGTALADVPVTVTYLVEGTAANIGSLAFAGTMALNTFEHYNTPAGTDVDVHTEQQWFNTNVNLTVPLTVDVRFPAITEPGATTVTAASNGPPLPPNFQLNYLGPYAAYLDISTTAVYEGPVEVCIGYVDANGDGVVDGTPASAAKLTILHWENGEWVPFATTVDTSARTICAPSPNGLSPFVVATLADDCAAMTVKAVKLKDTGSGQLVVRAILPVAAGAPVVGSAFTGLRVRLNDALGASIVDLLSPTGLFDPVTKEGWKLDPTSTRFAFRSKTTMGVRKARVKPVDATNYLVTMKAVGIPLPIPWLPTSLFIDTDDAIEPEGHCGTSSLLCTARSGSGFSCR